METRLGGAGSGEGFLLIASLGKVRCADVGRPEYRGQARVGRSRFGDAVSDSKTILSPGNKRRWVMAFDQSGRSEGRGYHLHGRDLAR